MKIDILTLFPEAFDSFLAHSMMKRAIAKKLVTMRTHDLRRWTHDRHRSCDDKPFGGGPGMLMTPAPIFEAYDEICGSASATKHGGLKKKRGKPRFIYLTPKGKRFDQAMAQRFSKEKRLVLLCGHYEGVDERVVEGLVTDELSIGDYVLTGGEFAAMVVIDAVVRLVPGVLGREESKEFESFNGNLLEYPQYTRPAVYRGLKVPGVLLSGDHRRIEEWRRREAEKVTRKRRPDLMKKE